MTAPQNPNEAQYLELMRTILERGSPRQDRTGVGTLSIFGYQMRFDLRKGFPLLTTKKLHVRSIVTELLWFLRGDTNVAFLHEHGVTIWDEWADERGELGPIYGKQWRRWQSPDGRTIDQLARVIEEIQRNPTSRRLVVSAWNVGELEVMRLAPCHVLFQFYVDGDWLSLQLYQRSADVFLGVPFNIASYSLLLAMVAQVCGYVQLSSSTHSAMRTCTATTLRRPSCNWSERRCHRRHSGSIPLCVRSMRLPMQTSRSPITKRIHTSKQRWLSDG